MKPEICAGCTCLCDDISSGGKLCELGQNWFHRAVKQASIQTSCRIHNDPCNLDSAIDHAASLLATARAPLICGLNALCNEAVQQAWVLSDTLQATIDTGLSNSGRSGYFSMVKHGKVTATLGEVAARSDLVVFWFCDPCITHPRHLERYSKPAGSSRKVIVVDQKQTATSAAADTFVHLRPFGAPAMLMAIRSTLAGIDIDWQITGEATGLSRTQILDLAAQMKNARYGSIFTGDGSGNSQFDLASDQLSQLVRELNQQSRFVHLHLREDQNALGAESLIAAASGFPFAVNYHRSMPRNHGLEYSAQSILSRAECDTVLLGPSAANEIGRNSDAARRHLLHIPTVELSHGEESTIDSTVFIPVARSDIDGSGDFHRQDGIQLASTASNSTERAPATQLLRQLVSEVSIKKGYPSG